MSVINADLKKRIEEYIAANRHCKSYTGCEGCPYEGQENCGSDVIEQILDELIELATVPPELEDGCKKLHQRYKFFEKRAKRIKEEVKVCSNWLVALDKKGQDKWTDLDTWRYGYYEGKQAAHFEWAAWLEDHLNE